MSHNTESQVPAFPIPGTDHGGLTAREYAAIHLRVPDSGVEWLDAMIVESRIMDIDYDIAMQGWNERFAPGGTLA